MLESTRTVNTITRSWSALASYVEPGVGHLFMYVTGRFQPVRRVAVGCYRCLPRKKTIVRSLTSSIEDLDVERAISSLRADGMASGLRLRPEAVEELKAFCENSICFGDGSRQLPFLTKNRAQAEATHGQNFTIGRYLGAVSTCSRLRSLTTDPTLLAIAKGYLGTEPALVGARIWWSYPASSDEARKKEDGQLFHFDLDDYRAISFFFYLSDVDEGAGPHVFVKGSHNWKPLQFLLSLGKSRTDEEIVRSYTAGKVTTVCGEAGSGFVEDLFCYHKGAHPKKTDRLLLQVRFGFKKYGRNREE